MDTSQWPQEIVVKPIENIVTNHNINTRTSSSKQVFDKKATTTRPQKEQALNCPRCNSTNTKFCYYNNYNLTQPRYFCKTCRRYWTEGGSLRNIPVGGGSRKNKRSSSSKKLHDHVITSPNPNKIHEVHQDLNLFSSSSSAMELLSGMTSRGLNSFIPMPVTDPNNIYTSEFNLQEFKPTLNFSIGSGYESLQGVQESDNGRMLFPFEDLNQISNNSNNIDQNREQQGGDSTGYCWNGMLGGGSWQ